MYTNLYKLNILSQNLTVKDSIITRKTVAYCLIVLSVDIDQEYISKIFFIFMHYIQLCPTVSSN